MLTGIEILLDRMKTNPEEFLTEKGSVPYEGEMFGGKWSDLLEYAWRVADKEERDALEAARKELYRDDFTERVFKRLAGEETKQETMKIKATERYNQSWADPRGMLGAGVLNTNTKAYADNGLTIEEYERQQRAARYNEVFNRAIQDEQMRQSNEAMREAQLRLEGLDIKSFRW